ncbi:hypothetical protein ACE6H2_022329 [Prunus campanulata]
MPPPGPGGPPGFGCLGVLISCAAAACWRAAVDPCLVGVLVGPAVDLVDPVVDLAGPLAFEYELAAAACDLLLHNVEFQVQYIYA